MIHKCTRCDHTWTPRSASGKRPKKCPSCSSTRWDVARKIRVSASRDGWTIEAAERKRGWEIIIDAPSGDRYTISGHNPAWMLGLLDDSLDFGALAREVKIRVALELGEG